MRPLRTLGDSWLVRYAPFSSIESYSYATASSYIPIDLSRLLDSNAAFADPSRLMVGPLSFFFIYTELFLCHRYEPYTNRFVLSGRL